MAAAEDDEDQRLRSVALQNPDSSARAHTSANDDLRRQSEWLRVTLASIGDGVISTDDQGMVTFMNGVAEHLTGWPLREASGQPLTEIFRIINERTRLPVANPALRALQEGKTVALANHTLLICRDGTERPIDDSAAPMLNDSGQAVGAVLVFRDVTERKRAEETRTRLAAIVESSQDAIVSKTLDGIVRSWNAGAERLFGYTAEEAIGQPITLIIPPERQAEEKLILERLRRGERIESFECVRVNKSGQRLDISLTVSPLRDAEGQVIGASKIARDITAQKQAQRERQRAQDDLALVTAESERRRRLYETVLANTLDFMYVFSLDHRVLYANEALLQTWGCSWQDAQGKTFLDIGYEPWHAEMHCREIDHVRETKQPIRGEVPFSGSQGRRMYDYIFVPVIGADGEVEAVAGTTRDVTDRRQMEDALREADRNKDEFIALLAHELRNPLAPLRNGLQVMRLGENDPAIIAEARSMMERQLGHMVRLIDDLLDISRLSQNKMELRRSRVLLSDILNTALETARSAIEAAGHELIVSLPDEPIYLDADLTRLAQVFSNLLTNSAKYTEYGGRIWLTAERRGQDVVVSVRDTGIGIPPGALQRVFDMFSQVDRSIERSSGGLGIGLALVKGLVAKHDGMVSAASEGVGKGSTFTVTLPILDTAAETEASTDTGTAIAVQKRRVLVVDDNLDSAVSMATMLTLVGNEVVTAHDGIAAVEVASQFRPDVILMDVGMPKLNGYDATRSIRAQEFGRPATIIALTGWGQQADRELSKAAGCDGHLVKPVGLADLEQLLSELANPSDSDAVPPEHS